MKWFILPAGVRILIDKINIPIVQSGGWTLNNKGYLISTSGKYKGDFLHRIIAEKAGLDTSDQIDHIDLDKLNVQLSNFRVVTNAQNQMNSKIQSNNTTGHKGVSYNKKRQNMKRILMENI